MGDPLHEYKIYKILNNLKSGKEIYTKIFAPTCNPVEPEKCDILEDNFKAAVKVAGGRGIKGAKEKKKVKDSDKKSRKSKKAAKAPKNAEILVPAEVFFSEPYYSVYQTSGPVPTLPKAYVLISVQQLMTEHQRNNLNPLVVKVHKLSNLPVEFLKALHISSVYVSINFPSVAQCKTVPKAVEETIRFNESHAHFMSTPCPLEFIELLRTQRLYVELRGTNEDTLDSSRHFIYGSIQHDSRFSEKSKVPAKSQDSGNQNQTNYIVLAIACYDLQPILKPPFHVKLTEPLHNPGNTSCLKTCTLYENYELQDIITVNEINLREVKKKDLSKALPEGSLFTKDTYLKISISTFKSQGTLLQALSTKNLYRRILVEIYDMEYAADLLLNSIEYNQSILNEKGPPFNFVKSSMKTYNNEMTESSNEIPESAITGFLIDNGTTVLLFVEGIQLGYVTHIWERLMNCPAKIARIFFNSKALFQQRIYTDFLKYGGIYNITLKCSLDKIMSHARMHIYGNVPVPCWKALKKLDLLLRCQTFKNINDFALFPTSKQLLSLDMEWGIAYMFGLKYKSQQQFYSKGN